MSTLCLLSALLTAPLWAAEPTFTPEGQLRPRWESDSGRDQDPSIGVVSYVSMRTRLGGTLALDGVTGRVVLSDVRVLGSEAHTRRDFDAEGLDVRVAVLGWQRGPLSLEVGRLEEGLHEERLLAIANWRQAGRIFDGIRGVWRRDRWMIEGRALLTREGDLVDLGTTDQGVPNTDDEGLFVLTGGLDAEASRLLPVAIVDYDGADELVRATAGVWSRTTRGPISVRAEGYLQVGTSSDAELRAGMLGVRTTWSPDVTGRPVLGLDYALLSANDNNPGRDTTFRTLYGANHKYYGNIDIAMFQIGGQADGQGLHDLQLLLQMSPAEALKLKLDLHGMWAADTGDRLAIEPDTQLQIRLAEPLKFVIGSNLWLPPAAGEREWMLWSMLDARF